VIAVEKIKIVKQ